MLEWADSVPGGVAMNPFPKDHRHENLTTTRTTRDVTVIKDVLQLTESKTK